VVITSATITTGYAHATSASLGCDARSADQTASAHHAEKATCMLGMADEFRDDGIAFNALWPRTGIATAAIKFALAGDEGMRHCRTPEIMADAAYAIFNKPSREFTGQFLIDDSFLYGEGLRDFDQYRVDPTASLMPDFFVPANSVPPPGVKVG